MIFQVLHKERMPIQKGFTLVETIIAISILMIGVLGPLTLAQRNLKTIRDAEDRLLATYLAQEGVEMVRSLVANNHADTLATPASWFDGIEQNATGPGGPTRGPGIFFDVTADISSRLNSFHSCNPPMGGGSLRWCAVNGWIYRDTNTGMYAQFFQGNPPGPNWIRTKFRRFFSPVVSGINSIDQARQVWSIVHWQRAQGAVDGSFNPFVSGNVFDSGKYVQVYADIHNWEFPLN